MPKLPVEPIHCNNTGNLTWGRRQTVIPRYNAKTLLLWESVNWKVQVVTFAYHFGRKSCQFCKASRSICWTRQARSKQHYSILKWQKCLHLFNGTNACICQTDLVEQHWGLHILLFKDTKRDTTPCLYTDISSSSSQSPSLLQINCVYNHPTAN